jgi:RHS repeat-associated protein
MREWIRKLQEVPSRGTRRVRVRPKWLHTTGALMLATAALALTTPATLGAATATAASASPAACGVCVLAPSDTTLGDTGNGTLGVHGAPIDVDSSGAAAVFVTNNGSITAPSVGVVGGVTTTGKATVANVTTGIAPVPDPLAGAVAPHLTPPAPVPSVLVTDQDSQTITPGVYQNVQVTGRGSLTLQPGVYVILGQFAASGQGQVVGDGVTIYLACSSYPTPCATGQSGGSVSLTGGGQISLSGGPSEGCTPLTIFADAKNATTITLTGGSADGVSDDIYAPSASLVVVGGGTLGIAGSIITSTLSLTGNAAVTVSPTGIPGCTGATPTVTGVIPDNGVTSGGNTVEVTGTNLAGATEVDFGATKVTSGIAVSPSGTSLTVEAPPGSIGTVDVRVTTPAGESPITPADHYTYTTPPSTPYSGASLTLSPSSAGPDAPFTQQTLDATLTSAGGQPLAGMEIAFTVAGANATAGDAPTGANGVAAFTYTGDNAGVDTVTAAFVAGADSVTSSPSTITWAAPTAPVAPVSLSPVLGNFYAEPTSATTFVATPLSTPAFAETFPDVAFNPPAGDVPDDRSGVGPTTHPFTDVTTDVTGAATGTQPAELGSERAGLGDLAAFDALFTANVTVASGGDASFSIQSADGFLLGIGNGASRVSGDFVNPPSSLDSAFDAYPLVAAYDQPSGNTVLTHPFTVAFPSAGTYPIEIDYFSVGSPNLSLVFSPAPAVATLPNTPPVNLYVGYEDTLRAANDFTITPLPWFGSPGVTFEGDSSSRGPGADAGGIRLDNVTNAPVTIDKVTVDIPFPNGTLDHFDQWPSSMVIPAGQTLILTENAGFASFDTSDVDTANPCGVVQKIVPQIHVTIGGATTTYLDTGEVLDTAGFDQACIGNESQPWVRVGTTGPAVPVSPPTREGAAAAWDAATNSFVLFGGLSEPGNKYLDDTWNWANGSWTLASPTTSPAARFGAAGAYDAATNTFVVFGGYNASTGVNYDDTWTWDGTNWTQQHPATSPPVLNQGSDRMAYDAADGQIVLVTSNVRGSQSPDTWTWDGTNWTEHAAATQPGPLWQPTLAYDPDTHSVVLFGGAAGYQGTDSSATWSWDGSNWSQLHPATSPPARSEATMDYDPLLHGLVLFSGTQHGSSGLDDTWLYANGNWSQLQPAAAAPARAEAVSAYDPVDDKEMVGFGITGGASVGSTSLGDLWFLDASRWGTNPAPTPPLPPSSSIILSPSQPLSLSDGTPQTFTVSVTAANGQPVPDLAVNVGVSGANPQTLTATTSTNGTATVSYAGPSAGTDRIQATALLNGLEEASNVTTATWTTPPVTIADPQPADGTRVVSPTPISASLSPPAGQTISQWSVQLQSTQPGSAPFTLASGTGAPPSPLTTLDPTVLDDGTYDVTISATSSAGGTQTVTTSVEVAGAMKFGEFTARWHELSVPVDGLTMTVDRDYDSFAHSGDFGPGWHVDVSNFQVGSGRALGAGGWEQFPTSCSLFGCNYSYATQNVTHDVTVTWPDGHQESWSFTPTGASFAGLQIVEPGYTPVPGTNTTDSLSSGGGLVFDGDGNLYDSTIFQVTNGTVYDPTEFTLTTRSGATYVLSTTSGLVSESDPAGNSITIDANGIHASNGESITFVRDPAHGDRITEITGPADGVNGEDQHWIYNYDAAGELASVTDPATTVDYSYNPEGFLTGSADAGTGATLLTVTYGADGKVTSVANGSNPPMLTTSDPGAMTQSFTDPSGRLTTTEHFDAAGDMIEQDQAFGATTLKTTYQYDPSGRLTQTVDPLGHVTSTVYDEAPGSPTNGDVLSETDADGNTWTYGAYSDTGQPGETINPDGSVANTATFDLATGYLASVDVPGLAPTTYAYDQNGELASLKDPGGGSFTFTYDGNGNRAIVTDAAGDTIHTVANPSGQVVQEVSPTGSTVDYSYDGNGNITSVTNVGTGATSSEILNGFGLPDSSTDANGRTTRYTYDGTGHVLTRTDPAGVLTSYAYDADGRLTSETTPTGTIHFAYDALGRIVEADNAVRQLDFTYDAVGNLLTQVSCAPQPAGQLCPSGSPTTAQTYDPAGNILSTTTAAGTTGYTYNSDEALATVTDPAGRGFVYGYDPQGRQASLTRPNGVDDGWTFNDANVPLSLTTTGPDGSVLAHATNTLDPATDQITQMTDLAGTSNFTYKADGTLASASYPAATRLPSESYTYDAAGNRITGPSPSNTSTYDAADELQSNATATYTWNVDGDLATKTVTATGVKTTYTWDANNQLLGISDTAGNSVSNSYDPFGRLVSETSGGKTTTYTWDGPTLLSEASGGVTTSMVTDPATEGTLYGIPTGAPAPTLEMDSGSSVSYPVTDTHDDWITATGPSGQLTQPTVEYSAFGTPATANGLPAGFDGYLSVGGGLDYAGGRFYDPSTGLFLSQDPLPALNPYSYAGNSPVTYVDPTGREDEVEEAELDSEDAYLAKAGEEKVSVYIARNADDECYVGITNQIGRRIRQHDGRFVVVTEIKADLTRDGAKIIEQTVIRQLGLGGKVGQTGQLLNKINSIAEGGPLWNLATAETSPFLDIAGILDNFSACP